MIKPCQVGTQNVRLTKVGSPKVPPDNKIRSAQLRPLLREASKPGPVRRGARKICWKHGFRVKNPWFPINNMTFPLNSTYIIQPLTHGFLSKTASACHVLHPRLWMLRRSLCPAQTKPRLQKSNMAGWKIYHL